MYRYKAMVLTDNGIEEQIIETTQDMARMQMHAHIHSIELLDDEPKKVEVKEQIKNEDKKSKK